MGLMQRYEISCTYCGVVCHDETLEAALRTARYQEGRHNEKGEAIRVFDRMAHHGKPHLWTPSGRVMGRRR